MRSRRRSEKPDKHVRLVLLAPSVTVAEWLRRQTVDLSTRVQFPPVTPTMRASFNGENTSVLTKKCRFDPGRLFRKGVEEFRHALANPVFCQVHLRGMRPEETRAFRDQLGHSRQGLISDPTILN